jgi:hypothetical protein
MPTDARHKAMMDKLRADFAEMAFLIAPGVLSAGPAPASNVLAGHEASTSEGSFGEGAMKIECTRTFGVRMP